MRVVTGLLLIFGLSALAFVGAQRVPRQPQVVPSVNLASYVGTWYAVASIPTTFERGCAQGTTAQYALLENGAIDVVNTCYDAEGQETVARGRAWIPDEDAPTKLKVSFVSLVGVWLFGGDYWILDLDPDYQYAVVGHPKRSYGWILSRTPTLPEETLDQLFESLEAQGYDRRDFRRIPPLDVSG